MSLRAAGETLGESPGRTQRNRQHACKGRRWEGDGLYRTLKRPMWPAGLTARDEAEEGPGAWSCKADTFCWKKFEKISSGYGNVQKGRYGGEEGK